MNLRRFISDYRLWKLTRALRKKLGREPTFGDLFAGAHGLTVEDPRFQAAMAEAVYEVTGEEW